MNDPKIPLSAQRRFGGGARREASERVTIRRQGAELTGWTLNLSRGGLRAVVEEPLRVGELVDLIVGDESDLRPGRVVWVKDEADGQIVGVQFLDTTGSIPPPDDLP